MKLKAVISGGGTGGHIFPAVAIANQIKKQVPQADILFIGAEGKMEMEKVPKAGYKIVGLPIVGLSRSLSPELLLFPIKFLKSLLKARAELRAFKPDIAIGVGGYASGPTLVVASLLGIPTLIQEQNSFAGITNKVLGRFAKKICVAYPGMERFFARERLVLTGNPVRADIIDTRPEKAQAIAFFGLDPTRKTILIIGGSQGARSINLAIAAGLQKLKDINIIWQTGKAFFETAASAAKAYPNIKIYDFVYDMPHAYAAADIVVSRSGASSISELCLVQKASVLVPFPAAAEDHQTHNALSLVNLQAALMVKDASAAENLVDTAIALLNNPDQIATMQQNVRALAKPNAAKEIVDHVLAIVKS
jgi:UDP-N-acetylglucosamine--N-acetylmuramyl-(pentapeptide) pyrophosphoryl-undecaprenol N-acetylglucosamine transferase